MVDADLTFRVIFGSIIFIIGLVVIIEGFRSGGSEKSSYIVTGIGIMVFSLTVFTDTVPSASTLLLLTH
jgi:hypothetical protein